jgi:hypothetical protein
MRQLILRDRPCADCGSEIRVPVRIGDPAVKLEPCMINVRRRCFVAMVNGDRIELFDQYSMCLRMGDEGALLRGRGGSKRSPALRQRVWPTG